MSLSFWGPNLYLTALLHNSVLCPDGGGTSTFAQTQVVAGVLVVHSGAS